MKKKKLDASVGNILKLFAKNLAKYKSESRRSYQKAFSSFQIFIIGHYQQESAFNENVITDWIIHNIVSGLSFKTLSFYLEKLSSLYTGVAFELQTGKTPVFKNAKLRFKTLSDSYPDMSHIKQMAEFLKLSREESKRGGKENPLISRILAYPFTSCGVEDENISAYWGCLALLAGIKAGEIRSILCNLPPILHFLKICDTFEITQPERERISKIVEESLAGEKPQWFAMRLRPRVKFENILDRFALLGKGFIVPELFYPNEEIARRIGRKVVWKGKPVIRDVVFFKMHKSKIYEMFTHLHDLAWCYRNPGVIPGNYASIPTKAMDDFKKSLGILSPDFDVSSSGEISIGPGDEVVIVNGEYFDERATVLKKPTIDKDGNKIYRVSLLNSNGHWDIGIDARLIKKTKPL